MKKFLALILALLLVLSMAACAEAEKEDTNADADQADSIDDVVASVDIHAKSEGVMTYAEYAAAELDTEVVIEAFVQASQSWWADSMTVYAQDQDGAYFLYNMVCSEEDSTKLVPGTKIKVTGYKAEWSGEVEIIDATFEIMEGTWIAEPMDATALLGTDELIEHQNKLVSFKGMTVVASTDADGNEVPFMYGWDGSGQEGTDSDLYFNVSINDQTYTFVVEYYLSNETTEVYKAVQNLQIGDVVDLEGFLYWYDGANPHIISVNVVG